MLAKLLALSLGKKIALGIGSFLAITTATASLTPPTSPAPDVQDVKSQTVTAPIVETKSITTTESIPFGTERHESGQLNHGVTQTTQEGKNGQKTLRYDVTYTNGAETSRKLVEETITIAPVAQIISTGTYVAPPPAPVAAPASDCDPNYSPCIPNVSYDLNCADIGMTVRVIGSDRHRLDRDKDGYGCE